MKISGGIKLNAWSLSVLGHAIILVICALLHPMNAPKLTKTRYIEIGLAMPISNVQKKTPDALLPKKIPTVSKERPAERSAKENEPKKAIVPRSIEKKSVIKKLVHRGMRKKKHHSKLHGKKTKYKRSRAKKHSTKRLPVLKSLIPPKRLQLRVLTSSPISHKKSIEKHHKQRMRSASAHKSAKIAKVALAPIALYTPNPKYPRWALRMKKSGRVLLELEVLVSGKIGRVKIRQSSGHRRLDDAAVNAVRRWRFQPARTNDKAISARIIVPIVFCIPP